MKYTDFLKNLDKRLEKYFELHKEYVCCKKGCSFCCEKGDYPLSQAELEYIMIGFSKLNDQQKIKVQKNIKLMQKGGKCPFLINKECAIYQFRPIICRVHGLAYLCKENMVKVPYCVNNNKNYSKVYDDGQININPIAENLDTSAIIKNLDFGEIRNLAEWVNNI